MQIDVSTFRGEAPKIAPRLLPNDMCQYSGGARLLSGDAGVWRGFVAGSNQIIASPASGIYYLDDQLWLSWNTSQLVGSAIEIDVAKANIGGDASFRAYFCGTDCPRFTDLGLASGLTSSGNPVTWSSTVAANPGPYPIYTRKLGVPNPTIQIGNTGATGLLPYVSTETAPGYTLAQVINENFLTPTDWNLNAVPGSALAQFLDTGGPISNGPCLNTRGINFSNAFGWKNEPLDNTQPMTFQVTFAYQRNANDYLLYSQVNFFTSLAPGATGGAVQLITTAPGLTVNFVPVSGGAIGANLFSVFIPSSSFGANWVTDADPNWTGLFPAKQAYTAVITVTPNNPTSTATVQIKLYKGTAATGSPVLTESYGNGTTIGVPNAGSGFGMGCTQISGQSFPDWAEVNFAGMIVSGTGVSPSTANDEYTTYVYTLVNDLGEESGPCPAMTTADGTGTILRALGQAVVVPLPASLTAAGVDPTYFEVNGYLPPLQIGPGGAPVTPNIPSPSMNLYRAVTSSSGTSFYLVAANVPFGSWTQVGTSGAAIPAGISTGVVDALPDSALSESLQSTLWAPPPTGMLGILSLPNGIYAGFVGNILCLSAQDVPHAWPPEYQLTFDFPIVGIQNIDSTVVVCTESFPYLCSGQTPDAYSQTKASYPYACASKRSVQFLQNVGVVFASYEGLVSIAGPGMERVLTRDLFSKLEWSKLNPASMTAAVNDNRYFCWYDATSIGGVKGGFYLDLQPQSPYPGIPSMVSGKCSLPFHATVRYNDPLTDGLYMVLDYSPLP